MDLDVTYSVQGLVEQEQVLTTSKTVPQIVNSDIGSKIDLSLSEVRLKVEVRAVKLPLAVRLQEEVLALVVLDVVVQVVVLAPAPARGGREALALLDGDVGHDGLLLPLDQHNLSPVVHVPAEHSVVSYI